MGHTFLPQPGLCFLPLLLLRFIGESLLPTVADAARPYESDTDLFQSLSLGQSKEAGLSEEGPGVGPLKLREKGKGPGRANVDDQDN